VLWAYVVFALAFCVKQHDILGAALSSALLLVSWLRKQTPLAPIVLAHALGVALVVAYLGMEEHLTAGALSQSIFVVPAELREVTGGSWSYVAFVFGETAKRTLGLLVLVFVSLLTAFARRNLRRLDALLTVWLVAELALMAVLCLGSAGAWYNYAMQAVLLACVLLGRSLAALLEAEPQSRRTAFALGCASLLVLALVARGVGITVKNRLASEAMLAQLLGDPRVRSRTAPERYFAGPVQHFNRRFGNPALLHDEWLYGAFEAVGAAEPRSRWLRDCLVAGPITLIIAPQRDATVSGVPDSLRDLGYEPVAEFGELRVWECRARVSGAVERAPGVTR
jgi:hypothetical protein